MSEQAKALHTLERHVACAISEIAFHRDWYVPLKPISRATGLSRDMVRALLKGMTDKGLTQYQSGLFNEDGVPAGSGYGLTKAGWEHFNLPEEETWNGS